MAGPELQHAQTQSLELRAKIAPQMQQSLNVLQATTLELNQMIGQELAQNPVLEEESVDISVEEEGLDKDEEDFDEEFSELSKLDQEWREYLQQSRSNTPRRDDDNARRQRMMDSIIEPQTLSEHLIEQLNTSDSNT
ncbi:MAG: RNA polymerase sigma-54 factor, partial [Verrucomicrobiota bacterium]|nr:RNA polymerase sigma-54 factor [Verrucomicrobiota bacterium]